MQVTGAIKSFILNLQFAELEFPNCFHCSMWEEFNWTAAVRVARYVNSDIFLC